MYRPVIVGQQDSPELAAHREKMLAALAEAWKHMPDLGLGQILAVASPVVLQLGIFGAEDEQILRQWQEFHLSCSEIEDMMEQQAASEDADSEDADSEAKGEDDNASQS